MGGAELLRGRRGTPRILHAGHAEFCPQVGWKGKPRILVNTQTFQVPFRQNFEQRLSIFPHFLLCTTSGKHFDVKHSIFEG